MVEKIVRLIDRGSPLSKDEIRTILQRSGRRTLIEIRKAVSSIGNAKPKRRPRRHR